MLARRRRLIIEKAKDMGVLLFFGGLFVYAILPFVLPTKPMRTVVFYGFSILGDALNKGVLPAFAEKWRAQTGEDVQFITSFAGSGTITNQIVMGVPAELGLLSLELDAMRIAKAHATPADSWRSLPFKGVLNRTPFIMMVRPGNPLGIKDFGDLTRPGVRIVHPDPLTSGGANWAIMAEYGSAALEGGEQAGHERLLGIWRNVVAQAASARAARTQFENGFGDVLITYEQEAVSDMQAGKLNAEVVYPSSTILSEHTLVIVERNVKPTQRPVIDALVEFLWSEPAQVIFVEYGFRSVLEPLNAANANLKTIQKPFYIDQFGGWSKAKTDVVDAIWRDRVLPEVRH